MMDGVEIREKPGKLLLLSASSQEQQATKSSVHTTER